jgi:hypothetical protein
MRFRTLPLQNGQQQAKPRMLPNTSGATRAILSWRLVVSVIGCASEVVVSSPGINISELDGLLFADAVDRLYRSEAERQVARLVDHWGMKSPPAEYLLGHLGPAYWRRFASANRQPLVDRENDRLEVTHSIGTEMRDQLALARLDWFARAIEPLLITLHSGEFLATGIREPGSQHGWQRELIPAGLFEAGHWVLCRKESRLIEVDRKGEETGVAYSAVKIHGPSRRGAVPDSADATRAAPARGSSPDTTEHRAEITGGPPPELNKRLDRGGSQAVPKTAPAYRTELPGRPSIKNLILCELERRARDGQMLGTVTSESKALATWAAANHPDAPSLPTARTIENLIRMKFRELARTK